MRWTHWYRERTAAGWSSLVARRAHNPKVAGSNPAPATKTTGQRPFPDPERASFSSGWLAEESTDECAIWSARNSNSQVRGLVGIRDLRPTHPIGAAVS